MSDQHSQRAASLEARLTDVKMEIDDDDEDVILVMVNLTNEAAIPMGGLNINITTSDGQKVSPKEGITSLGPGVSRSFTFEFPLDNGQWTFTTSGNGKKISLGPYEADFTYLEQAGRKLSNAIGSNLFTGAFTEHLGDFGNTEEKEIIDSSSIVLTTYHGENAEGGATKINVGAVAEIESEPEDTPRTPPWQTPDTVEPVSDPLSTALKQPANEVRTPAWENNETSTTVVASAPVDLLSVAAATIVAAEPEVVPSLVSSAPTGPPAVPSTPAPTGPPAIPSKPAPTHSSAPAPPSGPPSDSPTGPPAGPPSAAPSGPSSDSPTGPPSGPPSAAPSGPSSDSPTGPPSGPPSAAPSGPSSDSPTGPPSGPPSAAPSGPPSTPPSGPPSGPPATGPSSGPPSTPPSGPPAGPPSGPPAGPPSTPPSGPPARPSDL